MKKPKKSLKEGLSSSREFIKYSNIAIRMIIIILAGVFAGLKLDEYLEMKTSIFTLIFSIVAVVMAMYVIIREISSK
jgi:F0F1-type ATP synthase assembly protein I